MKIKEKIKTFWKLNKTGYIWSCVAFTLCSLFIGLVNHKDMNGVFLGTLIGFPLMLFMAFGISSLGGND